MQLRAERAWSIRGKIAFIGMCRTWLAVNLTVKERIIFITRGSIVDEMKKFFEYRQKKILYSLVVWQNTKHMVFIDFWLESE